MNALGVLAAFALVAGTLAAIGVAVPELSMTSNAEATVCGRIAGTHAGPVQGSGGSSHAELSVANLVTVGVSCEPLRL